MRKFSFLIWIAMASLCGATDYYVDPDYTGTKSGTAAQPWSTLDSSAWSTINTELASNPVTVYYSAYEENGTTQESQAIFLEILRTDHGSNLLTIDGHAKYNTNDSSPSWSDNSVAIASAYTNNQVVELTGASSQALGWTRTGGGTTQSRVSSGGRDYWCIDSHTSSSSSEPGVGASWTNFWSIRGVASATAWATSTEYYTYVKQDNITVRGFECTGVGARTTFLGDNVTFEYLHIHDVTSIGPGLNVLYNSHPDDNKDIVFHSTTNYECILEHTSGASTEPGTGADWQVFWEVTALDTNTPSWSTSTLYESDPRLVAVGATNMEIGHFRIETVHGECMYIGGANPGDTILDVDEDEFGNLNHDIFIHHGYFNNCGASGGQGDCIDCKNGVTKLHVADCEFDNCLNASGAGAVIFGQSFVSGLNQEHLVERCYFHDMAGAGTGRAIYVLSSTHPEAPYKGYNGITVRNCIVDTCKQGVMFGNVGELHNVFVYNNTIYNTTFEGIDIDALDGGVSSVTNNLLLQNNSSGAQVVFGGSAHDSDYNAYDGSSFGYGSEGTNTISVTTASEVTDAVGGDFTLKSGASSESAGVTIAGFSDDNTGKIRSVPWDIGAHELTAATNVWPTVPDVPANRLWIGVQ
jgi:hypothetical protein